MAIDAQLSYREKAAQGASPIGLTVLLYEQAISDLRSALAALEQGRVEERTEAINHALLVIGYLQSSLNFMNGGETAKTLETFYNILRSQLCLAQAKQSSGLLREQMDYLMLVREAWLEAERRLATTNAADPAPRHPLRSTSDGWSV